MTLATLFVAVAACRQAADPAAVARKSPLVPVALRCEHLTDPLGLDVKVPRLSWTFESAERAQRMTAHQILVATDPDVLAQNAADVWDSGKVDGDDSIDVEYAGSPLHSHQQCWWKVAVWDQEGRKSAWSAVARWSMGILEPKEWRAQWIGDDTERDLDAAAVSLDGAKWIGFANDPVQAPAGSRLYVARAHLPDDMKVTRAVVLVTADDRVSLVLNGQLLVKDEAEWETLARVDATKVVRAGVNEFRVQVQNDVAGSTGLILKLVAWDASGQRREIVTNDTWRATDAPDEKWQERALDSEKWPLVRVLGDYGCEPWKKGVRDATLRLPPPPCLRTTFRVEKPIRRATLYATALGLCDLYIDGARASDDYFTPGWSDYGKRVHVSAWDVTRRVQPGDNVLGAILADGWYSGYIGWGHQRDHYGKRPRLKAQLHVEYADGTSADVVTGPDWKARSGATREADFLMGESYDARIADAMADWSKPGSADAAPWHAVVADAEMEPALETHPGPPVRPYAEVATIELTQPKPNVWVFNLGQNFAGVARLSVEEPAGTSIQLRFAERLNPDGTIYTTNLRGARAIDRYVSGGHGVETWQPRFTFHGFQYVEVTGLTKPPTKEMITGIPLSSATPVVGSFECADPTLNRLWQNAYWTQRSNFIDVPTDCPQRDERLGWTGDAEVFCRTATYNTDVQGFFAKWLVDLADAQSPEGQFPMVAPLKVAGQDGGPAWADAGVICPWTMFEVYGDVRMLARSYPSMVKFVDYCRGRCGADLLPPEKFHCFGDWLNIQAETPHEVIFEAYFAHAADLVARAADALGKHDDVVRYRKLFDDVRKSFARAYVAPDGTIRGNTQTAYVLALSFRLLDEPLAKLATERLLADLEARKWHLSTGFVGTKDLMLVLAHAGRNDVAWRLLRNRDFPSWGFEIEHGATSIWERWDGWTPEHGFQDPGMNSFAHYAFGAVGQWMAENIGGVSNRPFLGWRSFRIAPSIDGELAWASFRYASPPGPIASSWRLDGDRLTLDVTIPPNTAAVVIVPTSDPASLTEGGKPLEGVPGIFASHAVDHAVSVNVGSGHYSFAAKR